ncbi:MAG TPA: hypothetical protein VN660_03075 [Steroidobacteraceae bacterium]|nr:hypothetical protein [Steroidobacteraceae bacterium]
MFTAAREHPGAALGTIAVLVSTLLMGCSGNGAGLDANGNPVSGASGTGGTIPLSADFDSIQANVFTPICSACHIGASAPQGLILDAQHSYSLLVNVPSTEEPGIPRIDPGNPDNSYLIQKIEGHAAVGGQMPLDQAPLPASTIAFIVQWVTDGAQPGASSQVAAATMAFDISAVVPEDGDSLPQPPNEIVVAFSRDLDATSVLTPSVRLERVDGAAGTSTASVVDTRLRMPAANPRAFMLQPVMPLAPGNYQLVLSGQPGMQIRALDGSRLKAPLPQEQADRVISHFSVAAP